MHPGQDMPWVEPVSPVAASILSESPSEGRSFVVTGLNGAGRSRVLAEARRVIAETIGEDRCLTVMPNGGCAMWKVLDNDRRDDALWDENWREILSATDLTVLWAHQSLLSARQRDWLKKVAEELPPVLFANPGVKSPFFIAKAFGTDVETVKRFRSRSNWDDVDELVTSCAGALPTYLIQLDNLEDYFDNEPQLMLTVQAALTRQVLRRAEKTTATVVQACVRNTVREYWLRRSGTDVTDNPNFLEVSWSNESMRAFVSQFLAREAPQWSGPPALCESEEVANPQRGTVEYLDEYLLRHTFLTPADVQRMLRYVCGKRRERDRPLPVDALRMAVNNQAIASAETFIHQVVSDLRSLPTANTVPDQDSLKLRLKEAISSHRAELISADELRDMASLWGDATAPFLIDGLWRQRLLTVCSEDGQRFCSATATDRLDGTKQLAFHSALIDLCQLDPAPEGFRLGYL